MGLRISTNLVSLAAQNQLRKTTEAQSKTLVRLASGKQITQAADDSAGLAISEHLGTQVRSLRQARRNADTAVSMIQTAEGGLTEISSMIVRLRELAIQSASDTLGDTERGYIQKEADLLVAEISRIAEVTEFNGIPLLSTKEVDGELSFQVGIQNNQDHRIQFDKSDVDVRAQELDIDGLTLDSASDARDAIDQLDGAMSKVLSVRATLGALQNHLQTASRVSSISEENLAQAQSQIADTDYAAEVSQLVRSQILQSAGIAVMAQANSSATQVLKLL